VRVLVTGGAGFIGSHLADAYLERGHEVYVIDNISTGSPGNIQHNLDSEHFHFIRDSIMNYERMLELIGICDVVVHLAAAVGVRYIIDNPLGSIQTNIQGTEIVLRLANKFRKKVFLASTSEVYGKHTHAPLLESDNVIYGPPSTWRWSYAASKLIDEYCALGYWRTHKLPVVIARLFNTVGPRQTGEYGMVIPRFVTQALAGEAITVYGDGQQTRTFTYVEDVVEAIMRLVDCREAEGEVVNIGGTKETTILALAQTIKEKTGSLSPIKFVPYEKAFRRDFEDMMRRVPSIDKLRRLTAFSPKVELDEMLSCIIDYFRAVSLKVA
jgi:UDP-glucose 4-epimerase